MNNTRLCVYKYKHYFHAHIIIYISIKVNAIHIFHMNIRLHHHIFCGRFLYIHTFFCSKIMCGCQLSICLYDIRYASCKHRLYHIRVAQSVPISVTFTFTLGKIYSQLIRAATPVLSRIAAAAIVYRHILLGKIRLT